MAEPLQKVSRSGKAYAHPKSVLKNINGALGLDPATLKRRLEVRDKASPDHITSECLVHLIRQAQRHNDADKANSLLPILLSRCELILKSKVDSRFIPNAEYLREEILQEFVVILANDGNEDKPHELDYYECRFNRAFMSLRIDILRRESNKCQRLPDDHSFDDEEEMGQATTIPAYPATQLEDVVVNDLLGKLSPKERMAFVLCRRMGYTEIAAADHCGVTTRTISTWLKNADKKLIALIQE